MDLSGKFLDEYGKTEMKAEEIQIMNDWVNFFRQRYKIIARLGDNRKDKWYCIKDSYYMRIHNILLLFPSCLSE